MDNVFSVDLEDYFMASAFERTVRRSEWSRMESRIGKNTDRLLGILDRHDVKATFFVLGWVAEHDARLVRRIHAEGHEIASHGYDHRLVYGQTPEAFREDVGRSKAIIENVIGESVLGYRAPSYSIDGRCPWAHDILIEAGFKYDSSVYPIHHDRYGDPSFSRRAVPVSRQGKGEILEIPLTTIRLLGQNIPVAGGGYFRLWPLKVTEWAIRRINEKEMRPAIFYIHPWEIDPGQPRIRGGMLSRMRHHVNIGRTESRIETLLGKFRFSTFRDVFSIAP